MRDLLVFKQGKVFLTSIEGAECVSADSAFMAVIGGHGVAAWFGRSVQVLRSV